MIEVLLVLAGVVAGGGGVLLYQRYRLRRRQYQLKEAGGVYEVRNVVTGKRLFIGDDLKQAKSVRGEARSNEIDAHLFVAGEDRG